jgi:hypothetical protein
MSRAKFVQIIEKTVRVIHSKIIPSKNVYTAYKINHHLTDAIYFILYNSNSYNDEQFLDDLTNYY